MTTLSTHDTKRNEDVRARQLAIADDLAGWDEVALSVREAATDCDVDGTTAYLLAQTLLGCWPIDVERLAGYMEKAVREAKLFTTWSRPDQDYEARVRRLVDSCCTGPVATVVERVTSRNAVAAGHVDVATKLLQLTLPGVPDVYQGTEIVSPALVDPDNRRPVDFAVRDRLLTELDDHGPRLDEADAEKLWVTSRALRLRRDRPDLFEASASYQPVITRSPHLLGFVRGGRVTTLVARWPATVERTGWGDASLDLPPGEWVDVLSGVRHRVGGALLRCDQVFRRRPAALLVLEGG
jgi:(1->4)-alpha-D-glucan 1-alpha-D-glucosylmutase